MTLWNIRYISYKGTTDTHWTGMWQKIPTGTKQMQPIEGQGTWAAATTTHAPSNVSDLLHQVAVGSILCVAPPCRARGGEGLVQRRAGDVP